MFRPHNEVNLHHNRSIIKAIFIPNLIPILGIRPITTKRKPVFDLFKKTNLCFVFFFTFTYFFRGLLVNTPKVWLLGHDGGNFKTQRLFIETCTEQLFNDLYQRKNLQYYIFLKWITLFSFVVGSQVE